MSYSDFTFQDLKTKLGLVIEQEGELFADTPAKDLPDLLREWLQDFASLGIAIGTEKARSEFVIGPFLACLRQANKDRISLFSGIPFNVDETAGLVGVADYILSGTKFQLDMEAPIVVVVEAKRENVIGGIPQCFAEMVGALRFNANRGNKETVVHGVVTSGTEWRFLRLAGNQGRVDAKDYLLDDAERIYGILEHIALGQKPELN